MKLKFISSILLFIGLSFGTKAIDFSSQPFKRVVIEDEKCFNEHTRVINVGAGIRGGSYINVTGGYQHTSSPAFSISYEQPWSKKLGPGFLGVGGFLAFQNDHYRYEHSNGNTYYYENNWNYFIAAARAVYHWDVLNSKKAEVYGGIIAGLRIQTYHYVTNDPTPNGNLYKDGSTGSVYPIATVFAGARWYFAKKVGVYGELGSGVSYATVGFSFKL